MRIAGRKSVERGFTLIELLAVLAIVAIAAAVLAAVFGQGFFVRESVALSAVEARGFAAPRVTARHDLFVSSWNRCADDDDAAFEVAATDAADRQVDLLVCCGWPLKGCTVNDR